MRDLKEHIMDSFMINEKLITFGNKAYPKFGQVVIMAGGAGCYPEGTEYFDGSKWCDIKDYTYGDILQYDKLTGEASLQKPKDFIELDTDQFYQIKNNRTSFITSETHKHLVISEKSKKLKDIQTIDLYDNDSVRGNKVKLLTSFKYGGEGLNLTDSEIRLKIAIFADGHVLPTKQPKIRISLKKKRKIERIKLIFEENNIEYNETLENGFSRFVFKYTSKDKEFEDYWYNASNDQLKVVCDEVLNWDGSVYTRENRTKTTKCFSTTSLKSKDFIQFAFSACDRDVSVYEDKREGRTLCYELNINSSVGVGIAKDKRHKSTTTIKKVDAGNKMYCFTTGTGYFVVRQNGKIYVSGNSGKGFIKDKLLGIEGRAFDVDALKELAIKSKRLAQKVKDETGHDLKQLDLKKPNDVFLLHEIIGGVYKVDNKQKAAQYASILAADATRKPNLIFDVTLKDLHKLESISKNVQSLGYPKENIHIVWVINDVEVAMQQNRERERVVPEEILLNTHKGVAVTMKDIIEMGGSLKKYMDGAIWFAFNKRNVDVKLDKSDAGGDYVTKTLIPFKNHEDLKLDMDKIIKYSVTVQIKEKGKPVNKNKMTKDLVDKIAEYTPKVNGF